MLIALHTAQAVCYLQNYTCQLQIERSLVRTRLAAFVGSPGRDVLNQSII